MATVLKVERTLVILILLFLFLKGNGQQFLYSGVEKVSVDGTIRPYNWDLDHFTNVETSLDSTIKRSGSYSFCFSSNEMNTQSLTFMAEPYQLLGNDISVSVAVFPEGQEVRGGLSTGFGKELPTYDYELFGDTVFQKYLDKGWTTLKTSFQMPDSADIGYISLLFEGKGKVCFDDLEFKINDQKVLQLDVASPFTVEEENWLTERAYDLQRVESSEVEDSNYYSVDLIEFLRLNKDTRIFGLGESTHGTADFFQLKHRLLSVLVKEMGVRIFAIEDNQLIVEGVNTYVRGGNGTARSCMQGMFSINQNREVHDLIQWVRDYNDLHPNDQISFMGIDMQFLPVMVDSLASFMITYFPAEKSNVDSLLKPMIENMWTSFDRSIEEKQEWMNSALAVQRKVNDLVDGYQLSEEGEVDSLQFIWRRQYTNLITQYARNILKGHLSLYRDEAMAENVSWILDNHPPQSKMVIWAHDYHVSSGEDEILKNNIYGGVSMGNHLRNKYGSQYKSFALWTYQGSYRAMPNYSNFEQFDCPLCLSPIGSLDEVFHRIATSRNVRGLFVDLAESRSQDWLCIPSPMRFANHVAFEYAYHT
ncbi:MAG: erythromycin esterase family protein, partial [Bacteroidota bacterium]